MAVKIEFNVGDRDKREFVYYATEIGTEKALVLRQEDFVKLANG